MNRANASRNAWHPQTKEERDAVLRELKKVVASPQFSSSKRYPALLQYVVEHALDGKSDLLKERTLGVEVFDRPPTYDTNTDTVVRFTAGEVRKRLMLYYHEQGRASQTEFHCRRAPTFQSSCTGMEESRRDRRRSSIAATPNNRWPILCGAARGDVGTGADCTFADRRSGPPRHPRNAILPQASSPNEADQPSSACLGWPALW